MGRSPKPRPRYRCPPRDSLRLKDPTQFRYIGRGQIGLIDGPDMTTGRGRYGIDTRLDGMLIAVVARPRVYGGKVVSFDATETLKIAGVVKVVEIAPTPDSPRIPASGRHRGDRPEQLGGAEGPRSPEDCLG